MEFDKYSHSLGESNFHFQFTPKYRRDVFRDVIIKKACEESFLRIAVKYKMVVRALEFGPDHVHLFLGKESIKILIPNKNYVLIKRFSTKEGKQRINVGIHLKKCSNSNYIGIENHLNYIYKNGGELTIDETYGIAALLNSKLYNHYFQITNGSTQVNVSEIRNFPFPPLEIVKEIGTLILNLKLTNIEKESIIINTLKIEEKISNEILRNDN